MLSVEYVESKKDRERKDRRQEGRRQGKAPATRLPHRQATVSRGSHSPLTFRGETLLLTPTRAKEAFSTCNYPVTLNNSSPPF